ncbi:hypothetical protein AB837_00633 [bacterium AB1]|nr:hypothetical protein AB837_00633 [bacterium AB1]
MIQLSLINVLIENLQNDDVKTLSEKIFNISQTNNIGIIKFFKLLLNLCEESLYFHVMFKLIEKHGNNVLNNIVEDLILNKNRMHFCNLTYCLFHLNYDNYENMNFIKEMIKIKVENKINVFIKKIKFVIKQLENNGLSYNEIHKSLSHIKNTSRLVKIIKAVCSYYLFEIENTNNYKYFENLKDEDKIQIYKNSIYCVIISLFQNS